MVVNKRWPVQPPTPKLYSPVQITGFIDGIDSYNDLPIIAVKDITLEIGNNVVVALAIPVLQRQFHTDIEYNYIWVYAASRAPLASVPSYDTPYPLPFPLQTSPGFIYPTIKDTVHPWIRDMSFLKRSRSRLTANMERDMTSAILTILIEESPMAAAHSLRASESMTLNLKEELQDVKDGTHDRLLAYWKAEKGKDEMRKWSCISRQSTHWLEGREGKDEMRKWLCMSRQGTHILEGREGKDEMRKWSCMSRDDTHKLEGRAGKDEMRK
ncbi:hypothetical protein M422DRAFT_262529 [Sphaerobolus stellatus SS14]|uniref:Uncharacterized protein n=1 Tax=Sphaerobolus stellatus (strain SS14) TaxID=990650 RepID=A0A0C9TXZ7_SPHS4|nr:hypothetical protein M422DRAFT_262529 [Sphaerobolus stellatus SS14]